MRKQYKVASISDNANSFGLKGHILVSRDGEAWEVGISICNPLERGSVHDCDFSQHVAPFPYEIPHRIATHCPAAMLAELWA